jgi:hypothetical protein
MGFSQTRWMDQAKRKINSFVLANVCDALLTGIALNLPGFVEKGILGQAMLADAKVIPLLIFKTAITAFMVGLYALVAHREGEWAGAVKVALQIGTVIVWVVVAWNELNIVLALGQMI